ncbi:MAG TPA: basic amino acid/polyamine antiporter [Solirubrobacterales bacterium]|nr:basic amino acid/polyamine antiporter [Solirubrobacterales bacterium]
MSGTGPAPKGNTGEARNLGLVALIGVVVGSMTGSAMFSLPQNMALKSAAGPVLIAWVIAGIGVFFIVSSFRILANERDDLNAGIYMYAREGFGSFMGFTAAWGYWLMACFGNVAYAVIFMETLDYFFPGTFTGGNTIPAIIGGSIMLWAFQTQVLAGIREAGKLNVIGTVAKAVPVLLFLVILAVTLDLTKLGSDFWGTAPAASSNLGDFASQLTAPMLVTLWAFIGVEGAVVLSGRARNERNVGRATVIGFCGALLVYILISILPFGHLSQTELSALANPSTAGVLDAVVGGWGAVLMNIALLLSVFASFLAWTLLIAEIPFAAGRNGTFPRAFARTNRNGAESVSLWVSTLVMQLTIILVYFSDHAWQTMLSVTSVMVIPSYLLSCLFLWKIAGGAREERLRTTGRSTALLSGICGSVFCLVILYAGGLQYVALVPVLLLAGVPVFIWSRREADDHRPAFTGRERIYVAILLLMNVGVLMLFASGVENLSAL